MLGDESCAFDGKKESPHFLTLHATHERGTRLRVKRCPFARCPGRLGASIVEVVTLGQTNSGPIIMKAIPLACLRKQQVSLGH
jgi:hypothetical protein